MNQLSVEDFVELSENEQMLMRCKAANLGGISNEAELEQRIIDFVHAQCLSGTPVKLANLNRRFIRTAKRIGREVSPTAYSLVEKGALKLFSLRAAVFVSSTYYANRERIWDNSEMPEDERQEIRAHFLSKAN